MLHRLLHRSVVINLHGDSYRLRDHHARNDQLRRTTTEAFFSSLEWEVLSRHDFTCTGQAQAVVIEWCYGFYNPQRRHSAAGGQSPINYENAALTREAA